MLRVIANQIEPGMVLAIPVLNPEQPGHVLLRAGYTLTEAVKKRLLDMGLEQVFVRFPALDRIARIVSTELAETQGKLACQVAAIFDQLQGRASGQRINYSQYVDVVEYVVKTLISHPTAQVYMLNAGGSAPSLRDHSLRVVYLATLMGLRLDWYLIKQRPLLKPAKARELKNLALGALLHDVGLLDRGDADPLAQRPDDAGWRRHVVAGYRAVGHSVEPSARAIIAQHHQRFDGLGFPEMRRGQHRVKAPLIGAQIHVFARITTAAKALDRLSFDEHGKRRSQLRALRDLVEPEQSDALDPIVLKALIDVVPPFSPGTVVRLSDGTRAGVTLHNPAVPCRPTVQPLDAVDEDGEPGSINLAQRRDLHIVEADGQNVEADLFELPPAINETQAA